MSHSEMTWGIEVSYVFRTKEGETVQLSSKEKEIFQKDCEASVRKLIKNRMGLGPIDQDPYYCQCEEADCPGKK